MMTDEDNFNIQDWCNEFKNLPTVRMDDQLARILMACIVGGVNREVIEDVFLYKVVMSRSEAIGLDIDQNLADFISLLCKSPGDATMYLSLLRQEQQNGSRATLENFVNIFPMGFPTQDDLGILWELQKDADSPLGNALDTNHWT